MDRPAFVLLAVGLVLALVAIATGGLSTGYGKGATAFLLRIGVAYAALGGAVAAFAPGSYRGALGAAVVAELVTFAVGAAVMYYDLVVTPPVYGTPLTAESLVATQVEFALVLAPVPVGYVVGTLYGHGKTGTGAVALIVTALLGWLGAAFVARSRGSAPGFTEMFFLIVAATAVGASIGPMLVGSLTVDGRSR